MRFNNVLAKKKNFLTIKAKFYKVQKLYFSKGVNPCFWSSNAIVFFVFGQKRTRNKV